MRICQFGQFWKLTSYEAIYPDQNTKYKNIKKNKKICTTEND